MGSELGQSAAKAMDMGRLYPRALSTHKQVSVNPSEVQELHAFEAR